jgi:hypothetical protein
VVRVLKAHTSCTRGTRKATSSERAKAGGVPVPVCDGFKPCNDGLSTTKSTTESENYNDSTTEFGVSTTRSTTKFGCRSGCRSPHVVREAFSWNLQPNLQPNLSCVGARLYRTVVTGKLLYRSPERFRNAEAHKLSLTLRTRAAKSVASQRSGLFVRAQQGIAELLTKQALSR